MDDIGEENVAGTQADAVALAGEYIAVQNAIHASR
jgi:hypothetical protein